MSLFSGLYTGASGLVTNQNALNTTAHNLANIDTIGYTRQQVTQGNKHYDTIGRSYISANQVGLGVSYSDVRAVRDYFLDKAYRLENGRSEYYNSNYQVITEMETLFGEMEGVAFQESLVELERTVQELQKNPSDATNQGLLVSKATTFLERAQAVYNGLASYQDNVNEQIKGLVEDINSYAKKIDEINHKITAIETGGIETANDLRDTRDLLLDKLSGLGNISYEENSKGVVTVKFEGIDLVTDDFAYEMGVFTKADLIKQLGGDTIDEILTQKGVSSLEELADTEPALANALEDLQYMEDDFYVPVWKSIGRMRVISTTETISSDLNTDIGALKALLNARGDKRGTYIDVDSELTDVEEKGNVYVNSTDKYNSTTARSSIVNMMAEFDNLIHGIVTGMNNILTGENGYSLFSQITENDKDSSGNPLPMEDGTDGWSTKNLMITTEVQQIPALLNDGFMQDDKSVNHTDADALAQLFQDDFDNLNPTTRAQLTFSEYYNALVGENAIRGQTYKNVSENQTVTVSSIDSQRQQVVGVSDDDELTYLIKYQNAYNASSRFINTVNSMLETLINSLA